ncbi:MAG: hypothetical protein LBP81_00035 [Treponema sp.]|jgi:hypothetical protein|nr:hypothetical protein [Treponema sp.]
MKVLQIKDIERKDVPIYYRRLFSGILVLELVNKQIERAISFTIETKPTGARDILVTLADPVDYPLVPLMKEIKKYLNELDDSGELPF